MTNLVADTERLRRLQLLGDAALSSLELDELLAALLERIGGLLDADTGIRIPVGRGFAGRVAAERRTSSCSISRRSRSDCSYPT